MTPVQKIDGPPWWATLGSHVLAVAIGIVVALVIIAPEQRENREALTPDTVKVYPPSPQASVDEYRARADTVGKKLERAEANLDACMSDRSILQAVQGVNLPQVTVRGSE